VSIINCIAADQYCTKIEGDAAMSDPPFFQSAGRGGLLFWGGKKGPTVVIWESLSKQEKESWLEEANTMGRVVQVKQRGGGNLLI